MRSSTNIQSIRKLAFGQNASASATIENFMPRFGVLVVALLAMATLQIFRAGHSRWLPMVGIEVVIFSALPWIVFGILRNRFKTSTNILTKTNLFGFQAGAMLVAVLVVIWQITIRRLGAGVANEFIALLTIQNVGWYLAVFSRVPGFEKTSSVLSGALVFFVCCIAEDWKVFLVAGMFAFAGLWWLLGQYWNRLETKAIDCDSRSLKLHGSAVSLTMLIVMLVACLVAAVPFSQKGTSMAGFMPFSGGERGSQDEFALSGVGDGNMLTAGNNATTTGAVESEEFIEDDKPSLYDVLSERYDGPVAKKKRNRTVSLNSIAKHMHEAKQSEQSGRTFRTMRNSDEVADIELEDRITKALFFVEGSVPARFSINNFRRFDGWDWNSELKDSEPKKLPRIVLSEQNGLPVFGFSRSIARYLTGRRSHRVKIMRLDSSTIPAPSLLQQWHIPLVNRQGMFRWGNAELIEMECDSIPTHTIIELQSLVPNYHLLRDHKGVQPAQSTDRSNQTASESETSDFLQVPALESKPTIQLLANEWTKDVKPGWMQVESIVNHLRNSFALNPNWETDTEADDSVQLFLDQNGGPSYMFATTCAMVLRSAGYKTRLANGFLVQKQDYDSRAQQSIVTSANVHMWPEVLIDGKFWIPVEPTPGYPIPYSTQTTWQWLTAQALNTCYWMWNNPITVALFIGFVSLAIVFRAEWITSLMFGWWFLVRTFWPQRLLKATRQLIDLRFWFAGDPRPASQTIPVWYKRVEANATATFFRLWNAENYSDRFARTSRRELVSTCHTVINSLSLKRIKDFRNENTINTPSQ